ncbi:MAG: NifB/NifX family molybdenum-iron cluster-binding protein [Chromatiales bacterium]|jgi:predicted Fe-Mo cluster-binding NifX family protein
MKKIVLTANDNLGLDGEMAMHFGHCPYFVVAHVNGDNRVEHAEVQANPYAQGHQPGQIPQYIKSLGADVVVAGGMGVKAIDWFRKLGIEVATGTREGIGATLDAYLAGTVIGASECDHDHDH